jgi:hypothetical protein
MPNVDAEIKAIKLALRLAALGSGKDAGNLAARPPRQ